jgi:arylsulfatase A-like enzyme
MCSTKIKPVIAVGEARIGLRIGIALLILVALVASPATGTDRVVCVDGTDRAPNILIILADDMGYSDPGCYGGEIHTPTLDALAAGGLRFTQFYNTARCWPSRASILTGYYAQQVRRDVLPGDPRGGGHGVRPVWAPLLPALLQPLGYRSYHSGKWHIDGLPIAGGFDRGYTLDDHDRFFYPQRHTLDDQPLPPVEPGGDYYATTAIADHAIDCLREHAKSHADRPFFQYLCFTAPHFPLHALEEDIDRYRERYRSGWDVLQRERGHRVKELGIVRHDPPAIERDLGPPYHFPQDLDTLGPGEVFLPLEWDRLTAEQQEFQAVKMAIHAAMVDRMDQEIGRVIAQLKEMGALDNTLILFASDNGASAEIMVRGDRHDPTAAPGSARSYLCLGPGWSSASNTPLRRHKTWVHEGGMTTPLIVHWPAGISARGQLRHTPAHLIDIVPTILELAGSSAPTTWQGQPVPTPPGHSLVPLFDADGAVEHADLWWFHDGHRAVRKGDWKLVANQGEPWELYDLAQDRGESNNLATSRPEKVRELEALWNQRAEEIRELATRDLPPEQPATKKQAKRAQGK